MYMTQWQGAFIGEENLLQMSANDDDYSKKTEDSNYLRHGWNKIRNFVIYKFNKRQITKN